MISHLHVAARKLWQSPGFTVVVVATLALGIGATTAIFSAVHGVLLQPLPYDRPDQLVLIWTRLPTGNILQAPSSPAAVADYRQARAFSGVAATDIVTQATLTGDGRPVHIKIVGATDNLFSVLGIKPLLGRGFSPGDVTPIAHDDRESDLQLLGDTMILSWDFWQRRFGGDRQVLGRSVRVEGRPMTVIGILPRDFELLLPPAAGIPAGIDAWTPLQIDLAGEPRDELWMRVIARLRPDVRLPEAQAEMESLAADHRASFKAPNNLGIQIYVTRMHEDLVAHVRPSLLALSGAVLLVLLIACGNVTSLLLARLQDRRQEIAIRSSLGARGWHLVRLMAVESLLLSFFGGVAGLLLTWGSVRLLLAVGAGHLPRATHITINGPVLLFSLLAILLTTVLLGMTPALESLRVHPSEALRARDGTLQRPLLRSALVVGEVALSLVLLIGAGLLLATFTRLRDIPPGFTPEQALTFKVMPSFQRYPDRAARIRFFVQLEESIAALPGVEAVGSSSHLPLSGRRWVGPYGLDGESPETWLRNEADMRVITPGYFAAMQIHLRSGRHLTGDDILNQRPVVIVDRLMAERAWPGERAVGKRFGVHLFDDPDWFDVVGEVEHVRQDDLTSDGRQAVYLPLHYLPDWPMTVVVRSATAPSILLAQIRRQAQLIDPDLAVFSVALLQEHLDRATATQRLVLMLVGVFAGAALVLAAVGVYGLVSYTVRQRAREISIRIALGARRRRIFALVLGRGLLLTLVGLACGLLASIPLRRIISGLLYGVGASDPATLTAVSVLLLAVSLMAGLLPSYRAAMLDPMVALRRRS